MRPHFLAAALVFAASSLAAAQQATASTKKSCPVAATPTPTPADDAFAKNQFADAERLYAAMPPSSEATAGVVRSQLAQRKLDDALSLIQKESASHPSDALLHDVLGEVRYRRGEV